MSTLTALATLSILTAACTASPIVTDSRTPESEPATVESSLTETLLPASRNPTPEATAKPDIENLPTDQVAQLLIEGAIEYPADWPDERKAELAITLAEYLNENVAADEAYVDLHFNEVGDIRVGWDPETERWRSSHNAAESLDLHGESLPPLFIPGYTNEEGREVFINLETGEETPVSEIVLPGESTPLSITELYNMNSEQLKNLAIKLMLEANNIDIPTAEYISEEFNHLILPVIMYRNARENDHTYQSIFRVITEYSQVPEAEVSFVDHLTNSVLAPVIDQGSNKVLFWVNIQQGVQWGNTRAFTLSSNGERTDFNYPSTNTVASNNISEWNNSLYGFNSKHSFGMLIPGTTTDITYDIIGNEPLLEGGIGIGSEEEITKIQNFSGDLKEYISLFKGLYLRLLVLYPFLEIHQSGG